jgi:hypothetical protein
VPVSVGRAVVPKSPAAIGLDVRADVEAVAGYPARRPVTTTWTLRPRSAAVSR